MRDKIRRLLAKHGSLHKSIDDVSDAFDLYEAGLTPFAAIRTMLALEEEFDVQFPVAMLRRQSFASVDSIAGCLEQLVPHSEGRHAA